MLVRLCHPVNGTSRLRENGFSYPSAHPTPYDLPLKIPNSGTNSYPNQVPLARTYP